MTLNPIEVYKEAGAKAGEARKHHDEAAADSWNRWLFRALAFENREERSKCRQAYDEAYRESRGLMQDPWQGMR